MYNLSKKTAIAFGMALAMSLPAHAVDNLTVEGYTKSSAGDAWTSSSGECVRTGYKDTQELLGECGYEIVKKEKLEVESASPAGTGVAIMEDTKVVKAGEVLAEKEEIVAERFIKNLQFGFDSADLSAADQAQLNEMAVDIESHRQLLRDDVAYMKVIGHSDSVGAAEYNQKLSERRARSVADYLAKTADVPRQTMVVQGMGETAPMADNATEEGRAMNRRVVIEIIKR